MLKGFFMDRLLNETLLRFHEVTRLFCARNSNRPIHLSTLIRWRTRGVRGIKLEAVRIGGRWFTSREALARFITRLTCAATDSSQVRSEPSANRKRMIGLANRQLDAMGV